MANQTDAILLVGLGTEQTFEFSVTYDTPTFTEKPDLEMLWDRMWFTIDAHGVRMPDPPSPKKRRATAKRSSASETDDSGAPRRRKVTTRSSDSGTSGGEGAGQKASRRTADTEATQDTGDRHPMVTRSRDASRAGCLRPAVGSGSNGDTCVASGNHSSKPGS
jgi:hypothetical protein